MSIAVAACTSLGPDTARTSFDQRAAPDAFPQWTDATVEEVDREQGVMTLNHGPIENLGMPAMIMAFKVADIAMLQRIQAGDKVRFDVEVRAGAPVIVRIEARQ